MEDFLRSWGYLGIFLGILSTGIPFFPMPEELPVVVGGVLAGHNLAYWWVMLPVCVLAVVVGDTMLYGAGRWWGTRLLDNGWIKKHVLPPARLQKIEDNFVKHGIKILLFARLTPGIRAPIFVTAGIVRLSLIRFVIADALYAVPGVALLFFLGYWFTESILQVIKEDVEKLKWIVILVMLVLVTGYFLYRFLRRPMVTGDPSEVPPLVEQVSHRIEQMTTKIMKPRSQESEVKGQKSAGRVGAVRSQQAGVGSQQGERRGVSATCQEPASTGSESRDGQVKQQSDGLVQPSEAKKPTI